MSAVLALLLIAVAQPDPAVACESCSLLSPPPLVTVDRLPSNPAGLTVNRDDARGQVVSAPAVQWRKRTFFEAVEIREVILPAAMMAALDMGVVASGFVTDKAVGSFNSPGVIALGVLGHLLLSPLWVALLGRAVGDGPFSEGLGTSIVGAYAGALSTVLVFVAALGLAYLMPPIFMPLVVAAFVAGRYALMPAMASFAAHRDQLIAVEF